MPPLLSSRQEAGLAGRITLSRNAAIPIVRIAVHRHHGNNADAAKRQSAKTVHICAHALLSPGASRDRSQRQAG